MVKKSNTFSFIFFVIRLGVAMMFISAGLSKVWDPGRFLLEIQAFQVLPYSAAYVIAFILPWLEIICGFAILTLTYASAASFLLMWLTAAFMAFIGITGAMGNEFNCGCFGKWNFIGNSSNHLYFNAAIFVALLVTYVRAARLQKVIEHDK